LNAGHDKRIGKERIDYLQRVDEQGIGKQAAYHLEEEEKFVTLQK
jgi:hypothetical protein